MCSCSSFNGEQIMSRIKSIIRELVHQILREKEEEFISKRKLTYDEPSLYMSDDTLEEDTNDLQSLEQDFKKLTGEPLTDKVFIINHRFDKYLKVIQHLNKKYGKIGKAPLYIQGNYVILKNDFFNLEEISTTSGVAEYETPFAFSKPGSDPKKKRAVKANPDWKVTNNIDESVEVECGEEPSPKRKIADAVKSMRNQLTEVEKLVDNAHMFKEETGTKSSEFYKRTHQHLRKIGEQLTRVMNKLQTIK